MNLDLEAVNVSFADGATRLHVLSDLNAHFKAAQLTAVTGPSGSGKSTLLAVAGGLLRPDSGKVRLGELDLAATTESQRAQARRDRIGFMFQTANLLPALTALEQLLLVVCLQGQSVRAARGRALDVLDDVGVKGRPTVVPASSPAVNVNELAWPGH